jgi:2-C-methyl-D-erythritol 4-phosphate cytidylyltransferase
MTVWAIVVAAGAGVRFGGPKQYEQLGERRVLDWAVETAAGVSDGIVLAVPPDRASQLEPRADVVVTGGSTRSESVRKALAVVPLDADVVIVHDAARPLATPRLFSAVVGALATGVDGAVPGVPVPDTIKRVRDGLVVGTLDRSELMAVQTPQAFRADVLRRAHAGDGEATDDATLVEAVGGRVVVVAGEMTNVKVTTAADLDWARQRAAHAFPERAR